MALNPEEMAVLLKEPGKVGKERQESRREEGAERRKTRRKKKTCHEENHKYALITFPRFFFPPQHQ